MSLLDQAQYAVIGLAKQKLPPRVGQFTDLAEILYRRAKTSSGSRSPVLTPGNKDPLAAARARSDPLMNFNWWCDMPILDGQQFSLGWEYVEEATLPFIEYEQTSNYRAGKNYHFAHHYSLGTLSLKFYEDSEGKSMNYMYHWQKMIQNTDTGIYNFPKDYKKPISIWVLDVAKMTVMCLEYTGCWPLRLDTYQFSSQSSERIVTGAEFSVDEIHCKFIKVPPGEIPSMVSAIGTDFPPRFSALPDLFPSSSVKLSFQ